MKKSFLTLCASFTLSSALLLVSCDDSETTGPSNQNSSADTLYTEVLNTFAAKVVVPTLADMEAKAVELHDLTVDLQKEPTDAQIAKVAQAWKDLRVPWECSEAFLFGPVAFLGLDPSLDSWPLDKSQLEGVLSSEHELNEDAIELLGFSVRGFHTAEYLIFNEGEVVEASSLSDRELEYLVAITAILSSNTAELHGAWITGEYEGSTGISYLEEFQNAGQPGSRYQTQKAAFDEIIEGMLGIIDEVASGKIGDPASENDPTLVESQFSYNSLIDFQNNMRSVQNGYLGFYHLSDNNTEGGLSSWVKERDAQLDSELRELMSASIADIGKIETPFRDNLDDENIDIAIKTMQDLAAKIELIKDLE